MKKLLLVLVAFVLIFSLSACNNGGTSEEVVMNWNIGADPATLDPGLNGASDGGNVINNAFEGLVREIDGEVYPGIAEDWEVSSGGRQVTFYLRDSNWSDGTPLTAHDFVYSWKRAMDPETASEYSWIWYYTNVVGANEVTTGDGSLDDVGIRAVDDHTFQVDLVNPTNYFVSLMAFYHFMPVKQEAVEAGPNGGWAKDPELFVSNGPFVLTEYTMSEGLVLEKNDEYWNVENVGLDKIDAEFIDDASTAYTKYNSDELDFIPSVPTSEVASLILDSDEFHVFPLLGTYYYSFNMDSNDDGVNEPGVDDVFVNRKLRRALSYSIDREAITETLGAGQVPAGGFVPPGFLDHNGDDFFETAGTYGLVTDDGNFAEAQTLFAEAATELGMSEAELQQLLETKTLLYNTSEGHKTVAELVQQMWNENLGFTINLANEEWAVFQETRSAGDFDIARGGWLTDYMDPSGLLSIFTSTNAYNDPNYYNETYDTLIADSIATTDEAEHYEKLYDAQEEFMTDMPIIPVYHYTDTMLVKSYVKDWGRSVLGSVDFSRAYIEQE
ncbi:MAG: peptide ABC transporter substrate-binding protein [Candidatus Izimaplasma sp.]|nr:peptide ABC transporter substrate-binding protein [Candidatus Izimaplasma bacterium]